MITCQFIPPYLLRRVASADVDADIARCGHATLAIDEALRSRRTVTPHAPDTGGAEVADWIVHTAENTPALPGRPVRSAGQPPSGDLAVDEAYAGIEASLGLFREALGRDSYDGHGATVLATVHYERSYDNAFWDGRQLVFGDGDGRVFERFTKPIDVLAHEFTHAVTQYAAGLVYQGQSGALNEHVSDVFAACVKQRELDQLPAEADWLIGEGIFRPTVNGRALRSMSAPGTAYDDPVVGTDPQVGHMRDYVHTREDNGGVHLNSGIPNRVFHLVATRLGGPSWERPARVWYAALTAGVRPTSGFADFAAATVGAAREHSTEVAGVVAEAWAEVGVTDTKVAVRRSGGIAGMTRSGEVQLGDDPRTPEVEQLLTHIDPTQVRQEPSQPDRFVYSFWLCGRELVVPEQDLTPELSRLAHLVLDD